MTIAITCKCSAHLEVDEKFAGQQITCPDCESSLLVPEPAQEVQHTSGLALASVVAALVGAFTIIGTLAAIAFGVVALLQIKTQPARLAGKNLAWTGIVLGVVLTGLSVFAYFSPELFGLDPMFRESQWVGKLDYSGDLHVRRPEDGFEITRPDHKWGIFISQEAKLHRRLSKKPQDFLMVNPSRSGYVLVLPEEMAFDATFDSYKEKGIHLFRHIEMTGSSLRRGFQEDVELEFYKKDNRKVEKEKEKKGIEYLEMKVDKTYHGQTRTFLLRIVKKSGDNLLFVVAGGTDKDKFDGMEKELREILNSFHVIDRAMVQQPGFNRPFGGGF